MIFAAMKWFKKHIKLILSLLIIGGVFYFFTTEFKKNWDDILEMDFSLNITLMIISFVLLIASYLGNTLIWRFLINSYHKDIDSITAKESFSIVNTTQLAKYLPGKVWSYAVQIYWLSKRGYSKSKVLFINVLATISTLLAASSIGVVMLAATLNNISRLLFVASIIGVILVYVIFIFFHSPILNFLIRLAAKLVKKEIEFVQISYMNMFITQSLYLLSNVVFCAGIYVLCLSIGIPNEPAIIVSMIGSLLVGDVAGFVVLVTPGGLGVREGLMFFILSGNVNKQYAIIIPIATRLLTMSVDIFLGLIALIMGRKMFFHKKESV